MCTRSAKLSQRQRAVSEVEHEIVRLRVRDQPAQRVGRMHDVGIGEHQVVRRELFFRRRDALLHRPQFAGPARRKRVAFDDGEACSRRQRRGGAARDIGGAVVAVVIDHDQRERRIVLAEQRGHALRDVVGLVARRDHDGDLRQRRGQRRDGRIVPLAAEPESPAREHEVEPDGERQRCKRQEQSSATR